MSMKAVLPLYFAISSSAFAWSQIGYVSGGGNGGGKGEGKGKGRGKGKGWKKWR